MEFTNTNFEKEVLKSDIPVLIEFWAKWCMPCRAISPIMDDLEKEYKGKAKVGKVNASENPAIVNKYDIVGLPTFILLKSGQEIERKTIFQTKKQLTKMLDRELGG